MSEAILGRGKRRRHGQPLRFVMWCAAAAGTGTLIYALVSTLILPSLRIDRIVVQADFEIDRAALLEIAGLDGSRQFYSIDPAAIETRLERIPQVRDAIVEKSFPNTIQIVMERRRPLLIALVPSGEGTVPAVIDRDGVIYSRGSTVDTTDLPVISGVTFSGNVIGSRLPDPVVDVVAALYRIRVEDPGLYSALSEVRIDPRNSGALDVVVYMTSFRIPIRMAPELTAETIAYALLILDVLTAEGADGSVAELDFRSGEIVYRLKEEESAR